MLIYCIQNIIIKTSKDIEDYKINIPNKEHKLSIFSGEGFDSFIKLPPTKNIWQARYLDFYNLFLNEDSMLFIIKYIERQCINTNQKRPKEIIFINPIRSKNFDTQPLKLKTKKRKVNKYGSISFKEKPEYEDNRIKRYKSFIKYLKDNFKFKGNILDTDNLYDLESEILRSTDKTEIAEQILGNLIKFQKDLNDSYLQELIDSITKTIDSTYQRNKEERAKQVREKVEKLNKKTQELKYTLETNITTHLKTQENIDDLEEKSKQLQKDSCQFNKKTNEVENGGSIAGYIIGFLFAFFAIVGIFTYLIIKRKSAFTYTPGLFLDK